MTEEQKKNERDDRILRETIVGVIPALHVSEKKAPLVFGRYCGIVFATNIITIAFMKRPTKAQSIGIDHYYFMKREWARYMNKPTREVLSNGKQFDCYIVPYSNITKISSAGTGIIQKRSTMRIHTRERTILFDVAISQKVLDREVIQLSRQAGVSFKIGEDVDA